MTLEELARVVWVRALEECDPDGDVVRRRVRDRASQQARDASGAVVAASAGATSSDTAAADAQAAAEPARFVLRRADNVLGELALTPGREGLARGWRAATRLPSGVLFASLAFLVGCAAEGIGQRNVNLLSTPLVGLLAWNAGLYALEVLRALGLRSGRALRGAAGALARLAERVRGRAPALSGYEAEFRARSRLAFGRSYASAAGAAALRPLRWRLHLASAGFALGAIAGLYAQGFAFAFRATWESTFLDAQAAATCLAVLLAPAQWIGLGTPEAATLASIEAPQHGPAALWIHRWAVSLLAWVVLPRLLLAGATAVRARRERGLLPPLDDAYFVRVLARRATSARSARVLPYAGEPDGPVLDRLRQLVSELLGARAELQLEGVAEYGDDPPTFEEGAAPEAVLLVFPLAQTPEAEVHGRYVEELRARLQALPAHPPCVVVLDEERYAQSAGPERCEQRRSAWQRVLREVDVEPVSLGAEPGLSDAALEGAARSLGRASASPKSERARGAAPQAGGSA